MLFSVYDYDKKCFKYYDGIAGIPATGFFRKARSAPIQGSFVPESFAVSLPLNAKPVGEGSMPKGYIAEDPRGLSSLPIPGDAAFSTRLSSQGFSLWTLAAVATLAYFVGKKMRGTS